jgi:hypothetical protein
LITGTRPLPKGGVFCYNIEVVEDLKMNLSELIEEIREIEIYGSDPTEWMGYDESDDYWVPDSELAY